MILRYLIFPCVLCSLFACSDGKYTTLSGKTMGTYYSIQYKSGKNFGQEIDSLLAGFISAASTYDSLSEISEFNRTGSLQFRSPYLYPMLIQAKDLHQNTFGAFEPTLMPLIRAYGFNRTKRLHLSQNKIDSLMSFVSFDYIQFDSDGMKTIKPGVELDLNAMGEGFAIELLSEFLDNKDIKDYKVEIGGEMKCKGKNPMKKKWTVGVENPMTQGKLLTTVQLQDEAISTSGVSRKFYTDSNGKKRSHLIDPKTGNSIRNNLLSVTIKNKDAVKADVLATACMVMGYEAATAFINQHQLSAFIVFEENDEVNTWASSDFFHRKDANDARVSQ